MKVASLVELIRPINKSGLPINDIFMKTQYTVRGFTKYGNMTGLLLEEVLNRIHWCGQEYAYNILDFKEIQPPMEVSIDEILKEPQTLEPCLQ